MTASPENPAELRAERAIRAWTRRASGQWTQADEAELQSWLAGSPENRAAFEKIARVWAVLGEAEGRIPRAALDEPSNKRRPLLWAAAATVLIALSIPGWQLFSAWWSGRPTTWSASRGETKSIVLADGTRILLDAGSELESRIGAHSRQVALLHGEALLTVVHDAARPFEVRVGSGRITDLGTRFDVESLGGRARICVLEGRVGVETPRGRVLLEAGRAGGYDRDGLLQEVEEIDTSVALWSDGQRHFNAERLAEVLERMKRYHSVDFVFTDPQLQALRVSGTFRTADLSLFLRTLQSALPLEFHWMDSQHVEISPRPGARPRE